MKTFTSLIGLLVAVSAPLGLAPDAHACSPPLPGLVASTPKDGDTYPANAALLFYGYDITLDAMTVMVDEQPAAFVGAPDIPDNSLGVAIAARISPEPKPGQTVELAGTFCADVNCEPSAITFTVGEPDNAPPGSPTAISFDIHDHADFVSSGGDCQSDTDLAFHVRVDAASAPAPSDSAVVLLVQAFRDASFQDLAFSRGQFLSGASGKVSVRTTVKALDGKPAQEALCFRASVRDVSGNAAPEVVETCEPCRYRKDDAGGSDSFVPEPMWTSADVVPGGPCDEGGSGGNGGSGGGGSGGGDAGGGDTSELRVAGCGCQLPGGETPGSVVALLALLAGAALRARRKNSLQSRSR